MEGGLPPLSDGARQVLLRRWLTTLVLLKGSFEAYLKLSQVHGNFLLEVDTILSLD